MPRPQPTGTPAACGEAGLGLLLTGGPSAPDRWAQAPEAFAAMEAAGCSGLWIADHLFWGSAMPEALVMAAVAATATTSCTVGTGVLQLPLRRPAAVAKAAATLQALSAGRFVLGVGTGEHAAEYERAGAEFARRGAILDAGIAELRSLWSEPTGWYGQRPVPAPVPIWVGGRSARALQRAADAGDGWMPIFVSPERFSAASADLDDRLRRAGRRPQDVARAPVAIVSTTSARWARADALAWMARLWQTDAGPLGRYLITGSTSECVAELARYRSAGADHVAVLPATDEPLEVFAALNQEFVACVPA